MRWSEYIAKEKKKNKYHNKKITLDGIEFDSQKEAERYSELVLLQKAGIITNLELQKEYILIPQQKKNGKVIERKCSYFADFSYTDVETGKNVVEDTKGIRTQVYKIKKKLMLYNYGIIIVET